MTLRSQSIASPCFRFALAAVIALSLTALTHPAAAEEPANGAPDDDTDAVVPERKVEATAEPPPAAAAKPAEAKPEAVGLVERLPPSAYPAPVIRGLHGGSLWLNAQGVQWPYLPRTTIGVSGYAWLDTNYRKLTDGNPTGKNKKDLAEQGRVLLRITPTYSKGEWFAQAQAELVANQQQTTPASNADVDDAWIRVGKWQAFDLTVGRFEAFDVYHLGMGLDTNTNERSGALGSNAAPPTLYNARFMFDRPAQAGNIALHAYPTQNLRFELLSQVGSDGGLNSLGVRPAAIFDLGWLKLKAAYEYQKQTDPKEGDRTKNNRRGGAGGVQFVFDPYVEFGGNVGYALVDAYDNNGVQVPERSTTDTSFGGFLNARVVPDVLIGVGANKVKESNQKYEAARGRYGEFSHLQTFAAVQYFWESTLMVKFVVAYAKADFDPTFAGGQLPYSNKMLSARLRFQLLF